MLSLKWSLAFQDVASLAVSRPESTVKPLDLEPREQVNSRQGSRLPTREKMGSRGRTVLADPTQMLAHRKSQLAKQQLAEAREREARLEEERELKRQEKMIRQKEIEEKLSESLEQEQEEIRRQRQLKAEVFSSSQYYQAPNITIILLLSSSRYY